MKPTVGALRGMAAKGAGRERERAGDRPSASPAAHAARGAAAAIAAAEACGRSLNATRDATSRTKMAAKTVVSMTNQFPTPRNQEKRRTCVAFASVAFLADKGSGVVCLTVGATVAILSPNDEHKTASRPLVFAPSLALGVVFLALLNGCPRGGCRLRGVVGS